MNRLLHLLYNLRLQGRVLSFQHKPEWPTN